MHHPYHALGQFKFPEMPEDLPLSLGAESWLDGSKEPPTPRISREESSR